MTRKHALHARRPFAQDARPPEAESVYLDAEELIIGPFRIPVGYMPTHELMALDDYLRDCVGGVERSAELAHDLQYTTEEYDDAVRAARRAASDEFAGLADTRVSAAALDVLRQATTRTEMLYALPEERLAALCEAVDLAIYNAIEKVREVVF
jgi:hypothetical protein